MNESSRPEPFFESETQSPIEAHTASVCLKLTVRNVHKENSAMATERVSLSKKWKFLATPFLTPRRCQNF